MRSKRFRGGVSRSPGHLSRQRSSHSLSRRSASPKRSPRASPRVSPRVSPRAESPRTRADRMYADFLRNIAERGREHKRLIRGERTPPTVKTEREIAKTEADYRRIYSNAVRDPKLIKPRLLSPDIHELSYQMRDYLYPGETFSMPYRPNGLYDGPNGS